MTRGAPLVVLNQLGARVGELIARQHPGVQVIHQDEPAWAHADAADVLLTAPRNHWRNAPADRPDGWPGRLRWVHTASVGIDFYPRWIFEGVQLSCARGVAATPIAEYVVAALLAHNQSQVAVAVHDPERWTAGLRQAEQRPATLLAGQTLGLVGYGAIGQAVARRAQALGLNVQVLRRTVPAAPEAGVQWVGSLTELVAQVDHLVLALPSTPETRHLLNAAVLAQARPGLHVINVARGSLIDQEALLEALDAGRVGAATLDVTDPEPLPQGHRLYRHPNVRLTPHISWAAGDVQAVTAAKFNEQLARYLAGQALLDVADPLRGY